LSGGELHRVAQPFQDAHHRLTRRRVQQVVDARDEQRDPHRHLRPDHQYAAGWRSRTRPPGDAPSPGSVSSSGVTTADGRSDRSRPPDSPSPGPPPGSGATSQDPAWGGSGTRLSSHPVTTPCDGGDSSATTASTPSSSAASSSPSSPP